MMAKNTKINDAVDNAGNLNSVRKVFFFDIFLKKKIDQGLKHERRIKINGDHIGFIFKAVLCGTHTKKKN